MSMEVDLNTPLTADERAYLNERGRLADIERADNLHGGTPEDAPEFNGDGTGPRTNQLNTGLAAVERPEVLIKQLQEMGYDVEVKPASTEDEDDDTEVPPYESWKVPELDAELKRRNLPVTGDKAAKANALYADDDRLSAEQ